MTWLYGPLHTANVDPAHKVSSPHDRLGIDGGASLATPGMKPILKHRTLSEMLTYNNPSSPILEATGMDYDVTASALDALGTSPGRPALIQTRSDTNVLRAHVPSRRRSPPRGPIVTRNSGSSTPAEPVSAADSGKRHISFNTFVEQCVAVDDPSEIPVLEDSDSSDDVLEMRSSSFSSRGSRPSIARSSSTASGSQSENLTIAKIAPTMLKVTGNYPSEALPQMVYAPPPEYLSPPLSAPQASPYDFPSPQMATRQRWPGEHEDEDEYDSVGFDYFAGNEAQQAQGQSGRAVQSHVGQASYRGPGAAPTVAAPPSQPKWRQAPSPAQQPVVSSSPVQGTASHAHTYGAHLAPGSDPSSLNSSNSGSPRVGATGLPVQGAHPGQPGRSILKVRTPQPKEAVSPPLGEMDKEREREYFDYTPSVATGIGGMNAYGRPSPPGAPAGPASLGAPVGSGAVPIAVGPGAGAAGVVLGSAGATATGEEPSRGRTASRDRGGSALSDRQGGSRTTSSSASTTSNASTSVSPGGGGASRSPLSEHHPTSHGPLYRRQGGQPSPPILGGGAGAMPPSAATSGSIAAQLSPGAVYGQGLRDGHGPVQRDPAAQGGGGSSSVQSKGRGSGAGAGAADPGGAGGGGAGAGGGLGGVVAKDEVEQRREEKRAQGNGDGDGDEDEVKLEDIVIPDRTTTPTPHSSPQVSLPSVPLCLSHSWVRSQLNPTNVGLWGC